ncbi:MAG: T9SS type A sorting domain-containing protein [Candidatus Kapaibacterium sp.]
MHYLNYNFPKVIIASLIIISFLFYKDISSQVIPESVVSKYNLNSKSTFFDIQKAMNEHWASHGVDGGYIMKNGEKEKVPYWKIYKRWEYYWEQRVNQVTGEFPKTTAVDEYEKYKQSPYYSPGNTDYSESWVNLGTNTTTGGYAGLGRINCIAFHPTLANTFWVGSPSGGIWRTTNGGTNWTILNNNMTVLGVSDIVIPSDYAASNTIYIATGDRDGGSMWSLNGGQSQDNASIGVYKSTDGGTTWNATGLTYTTSQKKLVYSLIIHPSDNSILLASTTDGIYKTTNAGTTWTRKFIYPSWRLAFKPGDPTRVYGAGETYSGSQWFSYSTDSGENWLEYEFGSGTNASRTELAIAPSDANIVYLLTSNSLGGVNGIYKSTNSGVNFTAVNSGSPAGMLGYYTDGSGGSGGQGTYDLCIAVKPDDANTIFIGGITTWKSTNGGVNFTANTSWTSHPSYNFSGAPVTHADKHAMIYQSASVFFEGNDGGIYKTTNGGTSWTDLSNGLAISQIYRIGVAQTSSTTVLTGLQDNGSKLFSGGSWSDVTGGDGMECIVDYSNAQYMYATYVRGTIYRSTNGGISFPTTISANLPGGQRTGAWVTPYIIDPNNSSTLIAGYDSVYKSTNRGNTWTLISQSLSTSAKLRSLAIAPSNSNILYTADRTAMWKTTNGGATNWTSVTLPALSGNYITYLTVKNTDQNTVWLTCGGYTSGTKVFESTNGGTNWTNISTGLPNLPVMCILHYKTATDRNVLFAGTDLGVYVKDGANSWVFYSNGLPNVVVTELDVYYNASGDRLRAGTYGRGLWETLIEGALPVELQSFTSHVNYNSVTLNWTTSSETNNKGFAVEKTPEGKNEWNKVGYVEGKGNSNQYVNYSFKENGITTGTYLYRLKQIDYNGNIKYHKLNSAVKIGVPEKFSLSQNYPNPFNPKTKIDFQIPAKGFVSIKVYDILGKEAAVLINETKDAGYYTVEFDGSKLSSGLYFYRITSGSFTKQLKMILIK